MPTRSGILRLAASVASGALLTLVFPPADFGPLVWIGLIPLLAALWNLSGPRSARKGFLLGWAAGFTFFVINLSWLNTVSWLGALVLAVYLGLFWAAFGAFAAKWGNPWRGGRADLRVVFANAAFWAGLEWLRSWLLTGFGWNGLGVALHGSLPRAQAADLFGVTGLSLVIVFTQGAVLAGIKRWRDEGGRKALPCLGVAAAVLVLLPVYGVIRMATVEKGETVKLRALLVQVNVPQDAARWLWEPEEVHIAYEEETEKALLPLKGTKEFPDWVIWPESALAYPLINDGKGAWGMREQNHQTIARVREAGPFTLMLGLNELEGAVDPEGLAPVKDGKAWNSMVVLTPEDKLQTFRKHHLVIFGETIPLVDKVPFLKEIYKQQAGTEYGGSFAEGENLDPLPVDVRGTSVGVIPSICFEDTVPRLERKFVRPGPQVIVNVTNDGWFKESPAAEQHFANSIFRAIELRRPMIRCANTGVTAAVTVTGSPLHPQTGKPQVLTDANGSHFTTGSLLVDVDIPLKPAFSLYALLGDWPVIAMGVAGWLAGFLRRKSVA